MNERDMELIERYLKGELSVEEKQQAEHRIATDAGFRQRLEIFSEYRQMHDSKLASFRQLLEEVQQEHREEQRPGRKYWLMAASVSVLCLLAAIFYFVQGPAAEPEALYAQYFEVPADNLSIRGDEDEQTVLNEAMSYYNNQQFEQASQDFGQWLRQYGESAPVLFYAAMSHMALEEMPQAIEQLEKITQEPTVAAEYRRPAQWYLALAYLHVGRQDRAKTLLEDLKNTSSSYAGKAARLLEDF
jgi:tetratricopeptide (TPR) repeat protein